MTHLVNRSRDFISYLYRCSHDKTPNLLNTIRLCGGVPDRILSISSLQTT